MKFTVCLLVIWAAVALASDEVVETAEDTTAEKIADNDKRQEKRGIVDSYGGYGYGDIASSYVGSAAYYGGSGSGSYGSYAPIAQTVAVAKPVAIPVEKPVAVPVPQPYPVHVPHAVPVPVKVPQPFAVHVPQPYPVVKHIPYPVEKHVPYPVYKHVPYPVPVPKPYPVHVPVYKHIHHYPKIVTTITERHHKGWNSW